MGRIRAAAFMIVALAAIVALAQPSPPASPKPPGEGGRALIGFSPATHEEHRRAEAKFQASVSPESMSAFHRSITRRPHIAGSAGSMEVAETIRKAFIAAGLEAEVHEYRVLLSTPQSIEVEITAPRREPLLVTEPPSPIDPDTSHSELGPGFVAYSGSATVTAPVVYVNYGLPSDYARVKATGADV
jgi:N-acetylated-alpha-linked acidic dipeptidase